MDALNNSAPNQTETELQLAVDSKWNISGT